MAWQTNANGNGLSRETNGVLRQTLMAMGCLCRCSLTTSQIKVYRLPLRPVIFPAWVDESCNGKVVPNAGLVLPILAVIGALVVMFVGFTGSCLNGIPPPGRRVGHSVLLPSTTPRGFPAPPVPLLPKPQWYQPLYSRKAVKRGHLVLGKRAKVLEDPHLSLCVHGCCRFV